MGVKDWVAIVKEASKEPDVRVCLAIMAAITVYALLAP